jgi:O-antigen ligase
VPLRSRPDEVHLPISRASQGVEFGRPPLHPIEAVLIGLTALHLCFLPWALGGVHEWSQFTSLGLSLLGFILSSLPRAEPTGIDETSPKRRWPLCRLMRSPVIWAGLIFLLYIAIQGLNPSWVFLSNPESWWLEPRDSISWLPTSVEAPFGHSNPWRVLTVFGSLALLVTSVWFGFSRRKSYHALFSLLATNACVLSVFGLVQRLSGTDRIFGSYLPSNRMFVASFIYPNHAGCYFNLMAGLAVGLAWWHHQRASKTLESPGAATAVMLFAVGCGSAVIVSYSRMSIALLMVFSSIIGCTLLLRLLQRNGPIHHRKESVPVILMLVAILCIGFATLNSERIKERFARISLTPGAIDLDRTLARRAAGEMFSDHWLLGWGAGCFRYGFPKYTKKYPAIHFSAEGNRRSWEHAHNDPIEFLSELGILGALPLIYILFYAAWQLWRRRFWRNVLSLSLVSGGVLTLLHGWVDFVFQNPAVLLTWGVLLAGVLRWTELDQPGGRQTSAKIS